ncbi:hypothetical protein ACEZDB_03965 [Streptacidiphilus sp. N1-3]|uniref:Uncharacterized protein n=1 Tax=Streptacidiphilus alkalitolerans TaxID=3342712 RepID=A0ABV6WV21_9ACTN
MYEMRAEETRAAEAAVVWHVVSKDSSATLCGQAAPAGVPGGGDKEATEQYCAPCMAAFGQAVEVGRSS